MKNQLDKFIGKCTYWLNSDSNAQFTLLILSVIYAFVRFNELPVNDWDEARQCVNAIRMYHNQDYFNLYYEQNILDTWNAKPPLLTWAIVFCYKLFGINTFALRLPVLLTGIGTVLIAYNIIRIHKSALYSLACVLILFCTKALFAWHISITADFDSLLIFFSLCTIYFLLKYIKSHGSKVYVYWAAISLGLAFYSKGPSAVVLMPGLVIFLLFKKQYQWIFKNKNTFLALFLWICIASSWIYISNVYGKKFTKNISYKGSQNNIQVLFYNDLIARFSNNSDFMQTDVENEHNYAFIPLVLDSRINIWNILFYATFGYLIWFHRKNLKTWFGELKSPKYEFLLLCICLSFPLGFFLSLVCNANNWYLAPVFIFIICMGFEAVYSVYKQFNWLKYIVITLYIFTGIRHFIYVSFPASDSRFDFVSNNKSKIKNASKIYLFKASQSLFAHVNLLNPNTELISKASQFNEIKKKDPDKLFIVEFKEKVYIK